PTRRRFEMLPAATTATKYATRSHDADDDDTPCYPHPPRPPNEPGSIREAAGRKPGGFFVPQCRGSLLLWGRFVTCLLLPRPQRALLAGARAGFQPCPTPQSPPHAQRQAHFSSSRTASISSASMTFLPSR